jgi:hypothetical protein
MLLYIALLTSAALAQPQQGTLSGTLFGVSGKGNAVLIFTNQSNGAVQRVTPNVNGGFTVSLPPGTYKVEVEREGFRQTARQNIEVTGGASSQVNVTIEGGPQIEAVEIKAEAPGAQDSGSEIGTGFTSGTVRTLPIFDRNYQELNGQVSGVTPPISGFPLTFDPQRNRQYNTNGLPAYTNDYLSEGITLREPFTNEMAIRILPDEAVKQLDAITDNYPSREGFAMGSISNVYPRPGTNGVHGSLFGFITDDFFRTRDPFVTTGQPQPTLHDRQFGGTIGGAIVRDRLFYFLSYQGNINDGSNTQFATVPTAAEAAGNFSGLGYPIYNPVTGLVNGVGRLPFAGGIIPRANINPVSMAYLSYLPSPNLPFAANNLEQNVHYFDRGNVLDGRMDYHIANNVTGFFRYGWSSFNSRDNSIFGPVIGGDTLGTLRNHHASASLAGNWHGMIAELRLGYSRYRNAILPGGDTTAFSSQLAGLGFGPGTSGIVPSLAVEGLGVLGTPINVPAKDVDNNYEGAANFHLYHGRNELIFGADVRDMNSSGFPNFAFGTTGSFTFGPGATSLVTGTIPTAAAFAQSFASFLVGTPSTSGLFSPVSTPTYHQRQYAGFIGDMIRFRHFTLNAGLRYEVYSPVSVNAASIFNLSASSLSSGNSVGNYYYKNFQPRVGIAIPITTNTVIRGSYVINSFPLPFSLLPINIAGAGTSLGAYGTYAFTPFVIPTAGAAGGTTPSNIPYVVNDLTRDPYVQSYYFLVEQSLRWGFLFNAGYLGNVTRELPFVKNLNAALPGSGIAGIPIAGQTAGLYLEGNGLISNYNSLQVNLNKRLSKGAGFSVAYAWSKALDYGTYLINPFNLSSNYGPADWDRNEMLTISHIFNLSWGSHANSNMFARALANWKLNGVFRWATGTPYNVYADPLGCACPGVAGNFAPGTMTGLVPPFTGILASATPSANVNGKATFNPTLFTAPPVGSFGNLGRNALRGPDLTVYNLSLFKAFAVHENTTLELRAEAYNLFNSTQLGNPYANVSLGTFGSPTPLTTSDGLFGGAGRTFVLGARVLF